MPISVQLSATRCLIKFLRKLPKDYLPASELIQAGLNPLLVLLSKCNIECVQLPVEAFAQLSK